MELTEMNGFKIDQRIWCKTVNGRLIRGIITQFHPNDSLGPAVSVIDEVHGSHRTVLLSGCSITKPSRRAKRG